ncbi:MAG: iron-sulfur cluster insertion protein ErpA [Sphingomonadales bacterium]
MSQTATTAETATQAPPPVSVSPSAARRIAQLIERQGNPNLKLRLAVLGGGCSGFQYKFDFDETKTEDDIAVERDGVTMLVDSMSLLYLSGCEVDYVEDLIGASFRVNNPNASSSCGCGSSFAV